MRLFVADEQLDLPADFGFEVTQNSPAFSDEGTQSIPVTIPATTRNNTVLGFPERIGRKGLYMRKFSSILDTGMRQKVGQLVIDSAEQKGGITGAMMLNESDLYSKIKDVDMVTIFEKIIRDEYTTPAGWADYLYQCMKGSIVDDFTLFPVAINYNEDTGYQVLNCPDTTSSLDPWKLIWDARTITKDSEQIDVPAGYMITPFLWMYRVIELLFAEYGYAVTTNPFKFAGSPYRKVVLLNNTVDTICAGRIKYSDLVPSCTVAEFLKFIETKFLVHAYITPETRSVDMVAMESILQSSADLDLTPFLNGEIKPIFSDAQEVDISSDTSLEGATPAADTVFDLAKKYSTVKKITEADWRTYNWQNWPAYTHHLVQRLATGGYYDLYFRREGGGVPSNIKFLGTNYFRFKRGEQASSEYKSSDLMPPMVSVPIWSSDTSEINVMCPYIGDGRNVNTVIDGESDDADQDIIIAFAAGKAVEETIPAFNSVYKQQLPAKYCLGTTQKYNNGGYVWSSLDLTTTDIYSTFFKRWDKVLRTSGCEIECRIDYPVKNLFSLKLSVMKILKGQLLIPESLTYTIAKKITHSKSKFMVVKDPESLNESDSIPFI